VRTVVAGRSLASVRDRLRPNQRLQLARAAYGAVTSDCHLSVFGGAATSSVGRGRCRAGETLIR
jgi:hypothetical protein